MDISVIIPVYIKPKNNPELIDLLQKVINKLNIRFEIIFQINDKDTGS